MCHSPGSSDEWRDRQRNDRADMDKHIQHCFHADVFKS